MSLRLYNTLTRSRDEFKPLDPKNVRLYVCGPTVYDYAHIGNARPVIVFDLLFRLLRHLYGADHVTYVRNITDIDDKINARAKDEGVSIRELTERTAKQFQADIAALNVLPPTHEPRASDSIPEMIGLIEKLVATGHAYVAEGHVLFDVPSMKDYGQLSRRPLDEMEAGARIDVAPYKKGDMDFVLWKPSTPDLPGWDSPWGRGRPGWHIECSAMSWKHLGEVFDIHGGGIDLIFPHHENELAQTRCAFGTKLMANVWMHNGFLQIDGQKMAKSLGNFVTINEVLKDWPGEVLRFNMLRTHYRQPIDWTLKSLEESGRILHGFYNSSAARLAEEERIAPAVLAALCDDLNTPKAIAELHALDKPGSQVELGATLNALGFTGKHIEEKAAQIDEAKVNALIAARLAARKSKNWAESDRLRDELGALGVVIKDNKDGTTSWEVKG
ncbi:MAG: cysteine--tRNA ligase [Parvibaculaceae bacterium]